jgi:hypothetical protein
VVKLGDVKANDERHAIHPPLCVSLIHIVISLRHTMPLSSDHCTRLHGKQLTMHESAEQPPSAHQPLCHRASAVFAFECEHSNAKSRDVKTFGHSQVLNQHRGQGKIR